jgi:hypothetical protein
VVDLFGRSEESRGDLVKASAEAGQRADVVVDGGAAQILEQVVVQMHPVQAGLCGENLVQVREVVVDEVGKRLRWVHAR